MPIPAGGLIPSGIGGCLVAGDLGADLTTPDCTEAQGSPQGGLLDVGRWQLQELFLTGECPHSGTMGAISRRRVGYDFRYSCEIPYDYNNPADEVLSGATTIALRFNLADATQEPLLAANHAAQRFYIAPSCILEAAIPVLDAVGDVIRMTCHGSGNGLIFLFPDDADSYKSYLTYMQSRGWNA
jgi:hypothetical protein